MVSAGYMAKHVATRPEWLERPGVADICSVSLCISKAFCDYCSPLSCNSLAKSIPVNAHCLLPTLERAKEALEARAFDHSEPGPFRVFSVYECPWR